MLKNNKQGISIIVLINFYINFNEESLGKGCASPSPPPLILSLKWEFLGIRIGK